MVRFSYQFGEDDRLGAFVDLKLFSSNKAGGSLLPGIDTSNPNV